MIRRWITALVSLAIMLGWAGPLRAQNPCADIGSDCRVMTAAEIKALTDRFLAIEAALPVPDPAAYAHDGAGEASTMPVVAESRIRGAVPTCLSWPSGCFTSLDSLAFIYNSLAERKKAAEKPKGLLGAVQGMMAGFENRVEVDARVRPHPRLVDDVNGKCVDVSDPEAVSVERSPTFLSWETGQESVSLYMIFGPRTCREAGTERLEKPAKAFAPIRSIEIEITGPRAEVAALKKKIDRKTFESLLGDLLK